MSRLLRVIVAAASALLVAHHAAPAAAGNRSDVTPNKYVDAKKAGSSLRYRLLQTFTPKAVKQVGKALPKAGRGTLLHVGFTPEKEQVFALQQGDASFRWFTTVSGETGRVGVQGAASFKPAAKSGAESRFFTTYGDTGHLFTGSVKGDVAEVRNELSRTTLLNEQAGLRQGAWVNAVETATIKHISPKVFEVQYAITVDRTADGQRVPNPVTKRGAVRIKVTGQRTGLDLQALAADGANAPLYRSLVMGAREKVLDPHREIYSPTEFGGAWLPYSLSLAALPTAAQMDTPR